MSALDTSMAIGDVRGREPISWSRFALLMLPFWVVQVAQLWLSNGAYHDDDVSHFLIARRAWSEPAMFLDVWGRPGFTIPYALTAIIGSPLTGLLASRILTLFLSTASAVQTTHVASRLGFVRPEWCGPLLMLVPLHFQLSVTTLTESICGFYLITATCFFIDRRWSAAAMLLGLAVLTRHEAIVIAAAGCVALLALRQYAAALLVWLPEVLWNAFSWFVDPLKLPFGRFFAANANHSYGSGGLTHGFWMWVEAAGPIAIGLTLWGGVLLLMAAIRNSNDAIGGTRPSESSGFGTLSILLDGIGRMLRHRDTVSLGLILIVGGAWGTVLLNTVLYSFNFFASGGYGRFLVPAAPWMVLCIHSAVVRIAETNRVISRPDTSESCSKPRPTFHWVNRLSPNGAVALTTLWVFAIISLGLMALGVDRWLYAYISTFIVAPIMAMVAGGLFVILLLWRLARLPYERVWLLAVCGVAAATWGVSWLGASQPLKLTPTQGLYAEACDWMRQHSPASRRYVAANSPFGEVFAAQAGFQTISLYELSRLHEAFYFLNDTQCMMERERTEIVTGLRAAKIHQITTDIRSSQSTNIPVYALEVHYSENPAPPRTETTSDGATSETPTEVLSKSR